MISLNWIEADLCPQAFDVLPDEDVWSGHYNQINFPERPTDKESNKVFKYLPTQLFADVVP